MTAKRSLKLTANSVTELAKSGFAGEAWDTELPGFHVRGGKRGLAFRFFYRNKVSRKQSVITLGRFGVLTVDQARKESKVLAGVVALGGDPASARREQQREAVRMEHSTLLAYLDGPHADYLSKRKSGDHTDSILRHHFADWMERPMESLTVDDLRAWVSKKKEDGLQWATVLRTWATIKTLLNQAAKGGVIAANPFRNHSIDDQAGHLTDDELAEAGTNERQPLTDEDIRCLFAGIEAYQEEKRGQRRRSLKHGKQHLQCLDSATFVDHVAPYILLALYTGVRPGDITGLTWGHIRDERRTIRKIIEKTAHKRVRRGRKR
ncbi:MAG: integrase family protein [Cellvibrionaceae bacterium]|nr:integrase family protein [Cellvibrionaceae bacterium]